MEPSVVAAIVTGFLAILGNQWALHLQNRRDNKKKADEELSKDNRLAFLLENFPPHRHDDHSGITYPHGFNLK